MRIFRQFLPSRAETSWLKAENEDISKFDGAPRPRIVIDGYFFQIAKTGIARLWVNVLRDWAQTGFGRHIILLDRGGTAPQLPEITTYKIAKFSYAKAQQDSLYLDKVCQGLRADLFVSTYYTTPIQTPSVFVGYDMIPEVMGFNLSEPMWVEKRRAIEHAAAHIMISENSARDLERLMPIVPAGSTTIAHCGVDPALKAKSPDEVQKFRQRYKIDRPFLLLVGDRVGGGATKYKNGKLAFEAMARMPDKGKYILFCAGGAKRLELPSDLKSRRRDFRREDLSDHDLACAYSGAHALLYPSRYEGFGLPVIEAMTCQCPVITCRNSSLTEIAGDAALFVNGDSAEELVQQIIALEDRRVRRVLIDRGTEQARHFTFESMARIIEQKLLEVDARLKSAKLHPSKDGSG